MPLRPVALILLALLSAGRASAVRHLYPELYPNAPKDKVHVPSKALISRYGGARPATIATARGTKNIAVILVQFPAGNTALISGSRSIVSASAVESYFTQMKAYYNEVSYGALNLNFVYFNRNGTVNGDSAPTAGQAGVYTLSNPMEYYGCGDEGVGCSGVTVPATGANGNYLSRDAIIAARNNGHTALKSVDAGGLYHALMIVHAGHGNETSSGTNGDIWSIFYSDDSDIIGGQSASDNQPVAVAAGFSESIVIPETETNGISSPLGVMCHEFGHALGLPDLYNTGLSGGSSVVGKWDLMDSGPYLNAGTNPAHLSAWHKAAMGWLTPTTAASRQNVTLEYAATTASALKIPVLNGLSQEYFLLEYRSRSSGAAYDRYIPGDGLLIWHVDDAIMSARGISADVTLQNTVNTGTPHYGLSIVAADDSSVGQNGGGPTNVYGNNRNFIPPRSNNFAGEASGISVLNLDGVGTSAITFQVANLIVSATQRVVKVVTFPNPAGTGYDHPRGQGHATIQMVLTRPANDYSYSIYTLSGDLVRKISSVDMTLNLDRSADVKWTYEYVWDLTNGDGAHVAPGVYLILARADGETKTVKAVIIR